MVRIDQREYISLATVEDIPGLIRLCKSSFPNSIRWQGVYQWAEKWWKVAISSQAAEVWVIKSLKNEILAFNVLVIDELMWNGQKIHRNKAFCLQLFSFFKKPVLAGKSLLQKFQSKKMEVKNSEVTVQNRVWLEMICVNSKYRGRGYAKKLMEHCENRSRFYERNAIILRVDMANYAAISLYKKMGYQKAAMSVEKGYYAKNLMI